MVPAGIDANNVNRGVLNTDSQQGRHVLVNLLSITELVDGSNLAGLVDSRLILHANLGAELVLGSEVELIQFVVNANDRGKADTILVTQQVNAIGILLEFCHLISITGSGNLLKIASEVNITGSCFYLNITDFSLVSGVAINHAQTSVEREVGNNLAGSTHRYTIVVLTASHVSVHIVTLGTKRL